MTKEMTQDERCPKCGSANVETTVRDEYGGETTWADGARQPGTAVVQGDVANMQRLRKELAVSELPSKELTTDAKLVDKLKRTMLAYALARHANPRSRKNALEQHAEEIKAALRMASAGGRR